MKEEKMRQKLMLMPLNQLEKKADKEFQLRRRMEEANKDGIVRCITCNTIGHYKSFDAGHFIPRGHKGTRHEVINVWPQCKRCNKWLNGDHARYRDQLIKKIGKDGVEHLEASKDLPKWGPGTSYRDWCIEVFIYSHHLIKTNFREIYG